MDETDRELVERARRGDGSAIAVLFSRYWRAARASAFAVTGDVASAEDAAAEGFRQAWTGLDSLRDPERFAPWLRTIVVRQARLARRPEARVPLGDLPDPNESPERALERSEMGALVQQLVRQLPRGLCEAVSLFYLEGYDSEAAARFLAIPPGTFRRRLHDGRSRLRRLVQRALKGGVPMNHERQREIERLERLIEQADGDGPEPLFQALRGALALRPASRDLMEVVFQRQKELAASHPAASARRFQDALNAIGPRLLGPSERALDPTHPVGAVAAMIRQALPEFEEWMLDAATAAEALLRGAQPPPFADARPGAFIRATRGLLFPGLKDSGRATLYQLLQGSSDHQAFMAGMRRVRLSDVFDINWMVEGSLDLRSVQELLERLIAAVAPGAQGTFGHYDEPRYRSALRMGFGDAPTPAAIGGVLAEWPDRPRGLEGAHVRIFLESWATLHAGRVIEFEEPPFVAPANDNRE